MIKFLMALTLLGSALGSALGQQDAVRAKFETQAAEIQGGAEVEKKRRDLVTQYTLKLDALQTRFATAGDLDGVVAVREEINRFEKNRSVEPGDRVASPAELQQLQQIFIDTLAGFEKEKQAALSALVAKYLEYLEEEQKRLVVAEKIEAAILVKKEIDRVKTEYGGGPDLRPVMPEAADFGASKAPASGTLSPEGLVLYWPFDEDPPGIVSDRSASRHDGKTYGNPDYIDGVRGKGIRISRASQYVQCDAKTFNMQGWRGGTISVWFNMQKKTTYGTLMSKSSLTYNKANPRKAAMGWNLGGTAGSGSFKMSGEKGYLMNTYGKDHATYPYPRIGEWQHLVMTGDGRVTRFYLNGELDTEVKKETPTPTLEEPDWNPFTLGKYRANRESWSDSYPNGIIDELMIWARPMGQAEIRTIYERDRVGAGRR